MGAPGPRSPLGQALDLFVFAPVGLALSIAEDLPGLAEKGRARVLQQAAAAKLIGQFAVAQGRRRFQAQGAGPAPRPAATPPPGAAPASPTSPRRAGTARGGTASADTVAAGPASPLPARPVPAAGQARPAGEGAPVPASGGLGIPGYDSLSASQVVQRLAGLSAAELDAVGAYEAATRRRRTILSRISQLQQP